MTATASVSRLGSEFDDFLYAPIGEDRNGMLLSVLSALARLDVDPWQEAAKLAQLPRQRAAQRLAGLIATLPEAASAEPDPVTIAARLIALLPRQGSYGLPGATPAGSAVVSKPWVLALYAAILAVAMSTQWIFAELQPQVLSPEAKASSSTDTTPWIVPPSAGQ
jgi:hypothetical protein